jgi:hypothetical protein
MLELERLDHKMKALNQPECLQQVNCNLSELDRDVRRMLRVQWKEFVHFMEDSQGPIADHSEDVVSLRHVSVRLTTSPSAA